MKRMFICSVGCKHAIEVERRENNEGTEWDDAINGPIDLNVWEVAWPDTLWQRLKQAWRLLRGRKALTEGICLTHAETQKMARFMLALSSAIHPKDVHSGAAGNTSFNCSCITVTTLPRKTG